MKHILYIISLFLALTLVASCTDKEAMRERLDYVSQCNRADTVFTEAWLPTVDSLVRFFDHHGNANERLMAHYLKGRVHHDLGEAPIALECYQKATEMADTTQKDCDLSTLASVYGQMAYLFNRQYLPDDEMKALRKAEHFAWKNKDTLTAIIGYRLRTRVYHLRCDTDSMLYVTNKCVEIYRKLGHNDLAAQLLLVPISVCLDRGQYEKAWKYMQVHEKESGFFDSNGNAMPDKELYYYYKGMYLLSQNQADNAISLFHKALSGGFLEAGYKGLLSAYEQKHIPDSITKYGRLYATGNDSTFMHVNQERVHQVSAMYNYNRQQMLATQKSVEAERIKWVAIVLSIALLLIMLISYMVLKRMKQRNKDRMIEMNAKYNRYLQDYSHIKNEYEHLLEQQDNLSNYVQEKEREMGELRQAMYALHHVDSQSYLWEMEDALLTSDIVIKFHDMAARGQKAGMSDWNQLRGFVNVYMPNFLKALSMRNEKINLKEIELCILIRLQFIPSEIATLLDSSAQSLSNLRVRLLRKMFGMEGTARDFNELINKIDIH